MKNIERASRLDISENRRVFLPIELPGLVIELYWDILPNSFDSLDFRAGIHPAPEGIVFVVFDNDKSEIHFLEILSGQHRTKQLNQVTSALDQWKKDLADNGIGFLGINLDRIKQKGSRAGAYVSVGCDSKGGCRQPKNESQQSFLSYPFTINEDLPRVDSIIGV